MYHCLTYYLLLIRDQVLLKLDVKFKKIDKLRMIRLVEKVAGEYGFIIL